MGASMNKTITRYRKTFKFLGVKFGESNEQWETVTMENVEPITPFIITEYEMEQFNIKKEE